MPTPARHRPRPARALSSSSDPGPRAALWQVLEVMGCVLAAQVAVLGAVQVLLPALAAPVALAAGLVLAAPLLLWRAGALPLAGGGRGRARPPRHERDRLLAALRQHAVIAVLDRRGRLREVSEPFCRLVGQPREALIGRGHRPLVAGALDRRRWRELRCVVAAGRAWRGEIVRAAPGDGPLGVDVLVVPLVGKHGEPPQRYLLLCHDISRHCRTERALAQANTVQRGILENLPCGLAVFGDDLDLMICNAEYRQLLDLPEALFAGPRTSYEQIVRCKAERGDYGAGDLGSLVSARIAVARQPMLQRMEHTREDGLTLDIRSAPLPGSSKAKSVRRL